MMNDENWIKWRLPDEFRRREGLEEKVFFARSNVIIRSIYKFGTMYYVGRKRESLFEKDGSLVYV